VTTATGRLHRLDGGNQLTRELIGGKAHSIQTMTSMGIPVPPAVVVTTDVCRDYHQSDRTLPDGLWEDLARAMSYLEEGTGRRFGDPGKPLLVSVRSGAASSMPGMMDTILNLGFDDDIESALAAETGDAPFAADTRRRFVEQFRSVTGAEPPATPTEQLHIAVRAVLDSWHSPRATSYRSSRGIPDGGGTAVTVQAMVFGNLDDQSGTGVLFTRNPLSGDAQPYGEWLTRGQGEDVVSGRCDAQPLDTLEAALPHVHRHLMEAAAAVERHSRDVQDIEFTVESGRLWLLQSRSAKRSPQAALRCAVHLEREGIITVAEALDRITADHVRTLLAPRLDPAEVAATPPVASGKPACPGIATGVVVTDPDEAEDMADEGVDVILARVTTDPNDVAAMSNSVAVLTELGGSTSHAAVVCREMAVPCIVGCGPGSVTALAGQTVTVDATNGTVYPGALTVLDPVSEHDDALQTVTSWLRAESVDDDADIADAVTLLNRRSPKETDE
jgi:pyruvate, orthophosphate dikinase